MKPGRIITTIAAILAGIAIFMALFFVFQRLLISGSKMVESLGDIEINAEIDEGEEETENTSPAVATWPPGDDPSWSEEMPLAPVDKTADELARVLETDNNQDK